MIWPWVLLTSTLASFAIVSAGAFTWTYIKSQEAEFHPRWCSPQYGEETTASTTQSTKPGGGFESAIPSTTGFIPKITESTVRITSRVATSAGSLSSSINEQNVLRAARLEIAEADGSPVAKTIRSSLPLTPEENVAVPEMFVKSSLMEGVLGFYRLGLVYLGQDAYEIAKDSPTQRGKRLYVPFCPPSNFVGTEPKQAYVYFSFVEKCSTWVNSRPEVKPWLEAMRARYRSSWGDTELAQLDADIDPAFQEYVDEFTDPDSAEREKGFCLGLWTPPDSERKRDCQSMTRSRQALKTGDAKLAVNDIEGARACWRMAIDLTETDPTGAPAAMTAQQRLQNNASTCRWTPESLARISRDYKARSGDMLHVRVLQQALGVLGHYEGPKDGQLSPMTRAAIRKFQRQREEDETDALSPLQMTLLICNAAEITSDPLSENTLGIMYAAGLGVSQDIDQALQWLKDAANRQQPEAAYNLAILYGTGVILNSYRLCDMQRSPEYADKYLQQAAGLGHPRARALLDFYSKFDARERWALIELKQLGRDSDATASYPSRLANIGARCAPDRNIR